MTKLYQAAVTRVLALIVATLLLLSSGGCVPLIIYQVSQEQGASTGTASLTEGAQGEYNQLSFDGLCDLLFEHEISWDNLTLNQLVANPQKLGIAVPRPATLGDYSFESTQADNRFYREVLESLINGTGFVRSELDQTDRLTCETLEETLRTTLRLEDYFYYDEPLAPSTGMHAMLPISLMDYSFRTVDDIDIYLELLEDTPRAFDQLLAHEKEKESRQILMAREAMESTITEARAYVGAAGSHVFISGFDELLDAALDTQEGLAGLSKTQIEDYKKQNSEAVANFVVPAYESLIAGLEALLPSTRVGTNLSNYARGAEYYELNMEVMGFAEGASRAAGTLDRALEGYWGILSDASLFSGGEDAETIPESVVQAIGSEPADYISYIQKHSADEFAPTDRLSYEVKLGSDDSPNDFAMAYFMLPPVDDPLKNTIVYFPRNISDDVELYSTMAHEGYPGHMYQTYAYSLEEPHNISKVIGSLAYTEGWAMYAQAQALRYLDADPYAIAAYVAYEKFIYGLHARVDIGVNFEGWSVGNVERYLAQWGFEYAAESLYDVSVKQPTAYLPYGLGLIEFDELRQRAEAQLGDGFNAAAFHHELTSLGPLSFALLESQVESWLNKGLSHEV
jgi:uncharacterized protein (DUF885 family)